MTERCGSFGCVLPKGHNMGRADVPANHDQQEPRTARGQNLVSLIDYPEQAVEVYRHDILAIEAEAAEQERERLIEQGWHEPYGIPDCGPIKARPHVHSYIWATGGTFTSEPPRGTCCNCGHRYGDPEADR